MMKLITQFADSFDNIAYETESVRLFQSDLVSRHEDYLEAMLLELAEPLGDEKLNEKIAEFDIGTLLLFDEIFPHLPQKTKTSEETLFSFDVTGFHGTSNRAVLYQIGKMKFIGYNSDDYLNGFYRVEIIKPSTALSDVSFFLLFLFERRFTVPEMDEGSLKFINKSIKPAYILSRLEERPEVTNPSKALSDFMDKLRNM